jgi:hypothetical protein
MNNLGLPSAAIVTPAGESLKQMAAQINRLHAEGNFRVLEGLEKRRQAGILLLRVRERVGRGFWLSWLHHNFRWSVRKAQDDMKLAREWDSKCAGTSAHLESRLKGLGEDLPEETEPIVRQVGDKSEEIDETPLPKFCGSCRQNGPALNCKECEAVREGKKPQPFQGETKFRWGPWKKLLARTAEIPKAITQVKGAEAGAEEYQRFVKALNEASKAFADWQERLQTPTIRLHRSA